MLERPTFTTQIICHLKGREESLTHILSCCLGFYAGIHVCTAIPANLSQKELEISPDRIQSTGTVYF